MARIPGAVWKPLPENRTEPEIKPRVLIFHSIVGSAQGAYNMFMNSSNLESHVIVPLEKEFWQLIDTDRQADANYKANDFAVSVETADWGHPDTEPWTDFQINTLVKIGVWFCTHYNIPAETPKTWNGRGVAYHTYFGAPSPWTPVAKTCPGKIRIKQFHDIVLPQIKRGVAAINQPEDDTMTAVEIEALAKAIATELKPVLDAVTAAGMIFVSNSDQPSWGVFAVTPLGLIHIPNPAKFGVIAAEGIAESVISLPGHAPIWSTPINTELP